MDTINLKTVYPCCGGKCRIVVVVDVPKEVYDRQCPKCGQRWEVERQFRLGRNVLRIDVLNWTKK